MHYKLKIRAFYQLKQSIQQFVDVESKSILEQQMIHQLKQINDYVEMITEFETNKADISRRQQRLTVYKDKQRLQHQLIDATLQHTDNEVEEQVYHLNARLKLQLLDDVKSVFNSQMTQNSDFNEEKKVSTKVYFRSNSSTIVFRAIFNYRTYKKIL